MRVFLADDKTDHRIPFAVVVQFWAWAAVLRPLKHLLPIGMLVGLMRTHRRRTDCDAERASAIAAYLRARGRFPRRAPGNCLERSLAAYRLFGAAGADAELWVGVKRAADRQAIQGHVWLSVDEHPVSDDREALDQFTPLVRFDAAGDRQKPPRTSNASSGSMAGD